MERRIKATSVECMAMDRQCQTRHSGLAPISTYASAATLYEVAFILSCAPELRISPVTWSIQGHATPGIYAAPFLEGRIDERQLHNFRTGAGRWRRALFHYRTLISCLIFGSSDGSMGWGHCSRSTRRASIVICARRDLWTERAQGVGVIGDGKPTNRKLSAH